MKAQRAEVKGKLMQQAELLIDQLLDWNEHTAEPNLTQIEDIVLQLRKQLGEQMALAVIDHQATKRPTSGPCCQQCQREMHYKDMVTVQVVDESGNNDGGLSPWIAAAQAAVR